MARTAITSPNPVSRVWRGRCARRWRSIRAPPAKCHPQRVSSAAESLSPRRRVTMPVYTVHAPVANGAAIAAIDRFAFVRDGFHFWAAVFGPLWLVWHRLWLALIGWIVVALAINVGMARLGADGTAIFWVDVLIALLMGFEASSIRRLTLSRHNWRQLELTPVVPRQGQAPDARRFKSHQQRDQHVHPKDRGAVGTKSRHSDIDRERNNDPADQRQPQPMPDKPQRTENRSPEMKSVADECEPIDSGDRRTVRYRSMNCIDRHRYSPPRT